MYCKNCGKEVAENADVCVSCGVRLIKNDSKEWLIALLLAIFLGGLGIHRFYTGHKGTGLTMLLLSIFGAFTFIFYIGALLFIIVGIWVLIDIIRIATGSFKDVHGNPLKR